ncbi:MAG: hypothetical protein JXB49_24670 [Bacteroidales bacterium]|nr:hypothetical protein [Bacteroidales bacterium]
MDTNEAIYLTEELRREAIKSRNKHLKRIFEYKSKQKNDWLIDVDYNMGDPLILVAVYFLYEGRLNAVLVLSDKNTLVHYSSHFLERYNERFLKQDNISKLDLLKRFLPQNNVTTFDITTYSSGHKDTVFARFKDGIGLGFFEQLRNNKMVFLKTYISPEMIKKYQKKGYESITDAFTEHWDEFLKIKGKDA